jgi:proliferating cell nuclear antigen
MDIVLKDAKRCEQFAMLFQHMKTFCDHVNIIFEKTQLFVQAMDNSHVSIMDLKLPASWFDVYDHKSDSNITIGVSSSMLFRILNARDKTQEMNIVYDGGETDNLYIHYTAGTKTEFDKHFELPLMEIDSQLMDIPPMDYQAEITLSSEHFANIVKQLKMFGDTLEIQCSEDKIMLVSHSQDQGKMFVEIKINDVSEFAIEEGAQLQLSFSLTYLSNMCLYNKLASEVELKFIVDAPLMLKYNLGENASMCFYLAPKINDE